MRLPMLLLLTTLPVLSGCALAVGGAAAIVIDEIAEENGRDLF